MEVMLAGDGCAVTSLPEVDDVEICGENLFVAVAVTEMDR